jgi:hypothetical protein
MKRPIPATTSPFEAAEVAQCSENVDAMAEAAA